MNVKDEEFKGLMEKYKKFSVYGLSPDPSKPSHYVPLYMRTNGWDVVGSYPQIHSVDEFQIVASLAEIPAEYRKFVDVFRSSEKIPDVVDEVLSIGGVEVLWLQLGISHPEAEARAEKAGIRVISNRCLLREHEIWF